MFFNVFLKFGLMIDNATSQRFLIANFLDKHPVILRVF